MNLSPPSGPSLTLRLAAAYNVVWGALVVLFPHLLFDLTGAERPFYPEIWQCVGMIVGVYGVGYGIASFAPLRHWPIVLVGFLGKVLGPVGFAWALWQGTFPLAFFWVIVFNDLIWWIPFSRLLLRAFRENTRVGSEDDEIPPMEEALQTWTPLEEAKSLHELSSEQPLLLLFLRHSGCTFCRSTLQQLAASEDAFRRDGIRLALVLMSEPDSARRFVHRFGLQDALIVSDPHRILYRSVGLRRGTWRELFGLRVWWSGFGEALVQRHGMGPLDGDGFQMPGAFLLKDGRIQATYRHSSAADVPPFAAWAAREVGKDGPVAT
ncbi:MAG: SelL-related redox protein [Verrucomicrobiota bacterium]